MRVRLFAVVLATAFLVVGCTGQPPAGPVVGISAGGNHTCVVRGNGTVACLGDNAARWLRDGRRPGSGVAL